MSLYPAVSEDLSQLSIDTAGRLTRQLPSLTAGQLPTTGVAILVPTELKSDQHCQDILDKYHTEDPEKDLKELQNQLLGCLSEWQSDKIEQQSFDTRDAFDNRNFAADFNRAETNRILHSAQKKHELVLLSAAPKVSSSCPATLKHGLELDLPEEMSEFIALHYSYPDTPVKFYGDFFQHPIGEAELHQLHTVLGPVPTIGIYGTISDHKIYIHAGIWHLQSAELFKFNFTAWDWTAAFDKLRAAEHSETKSLRAIRQGVTTIYQLLAAFAIDLYFLQLYPIYTIKLPQIESYFTNAGLTVETVQAYVKILTDIQTQQHQEHRQELQAMAPPPTALVAKPVEIFQEWELTDTLLGHEESVYSISFSPDGKLLASASHDQTIKLWHLATRKEFRSLTGHLWVYDVAFSHDGQLLASANGDHTVKLWEVHSCSELKTLEAHTGNVAAVVFVPNTQMVISGSWDYTIKIWNTKTGNRIRTLNGHTSLVNCLAISPNGHALASGSHDQSIKLWSLKTGQEMLVLNGHESSVNTVAFSPNSEMLASASDDRTIKMWNLKTGQIVHSFDGFLSAINSVCFSPDGKYLASAGDDKSIKIWSMESGKTVQTLFGHEDSVYHIAFSPDGQILGSSSSDNTIKLWQQKAVLSTKI
jgi:WD40 repeat protein